MSSSGVSWNSQILADQLTLSQLRGPDYAHQIILAPPDFQTFLRPCLYTNESVTFSQCNGHHKSGVHLIKSKAVEDTRYNIMKCLNKEHNHQGLIEVQSIATNLDGNMACLMIFQLHSSNFTTSLDEKN